MHSTFFLSGCKGREASFLPLVSLLQSTVLPTSLTEINAALKLEGACKLQTCSEVKWHRRVQPQTLRYLPVVEKILLTIIQKVLVMKEISFAVIMGPKYALLSTAIFVFFFSRFPWMMKMNLALYFLRLKKKIIWLISFLIAIQSILISDSHF